MNYKPTQLLFIDATINDIETLLQGALPGIEAHVLSDQQDGIAQITQILQHRPEVNTVHIVSHGSPGCLYLGKSQLSLDTLNIYTSQVQSWSRDGLTLMLYGCNVAVGDAGEEFVNKLHQLTGANIAASVTLTGNANLGGNWILEMKIGVIDAPLAITPSTQSAYAGILPSLIPDSSILPNVGYSSLAWGDYTGDGKLDLILTGYNSAYSTKLYKNDGSGVLSDDTSVGLSGVSNIAASSVAWGDYTGDGKLDLILTGQTSNGTTDISKLYKNDGSGVLTEDTSLTLPGVEYSSVAWGDYTGDGKLDLILTGSGISKLYKNDGIGGLTEDTSLEATLNLPGVSNSSVAWGDYTGDGKLDLILTGSGISKLYKNDGIGGLTEDTSLEATLNLPGVSNSSVAWGDYTGDGKLDLILTGQTSSGYISQLYKNNTPTLTTPTAISYIDTANDDTFTAQGSTLMAISPDALTLTYGITGGTVSGTTVTKTGTYGTLSLDTSSGAYTFTPVDSAIEALTSNATDSFTFTVSDSNGGTDSKTLALNLTGVNDTPTLNTPTAISYTDTANDDTFNDQTGTLTATDPDGGQTLTYGITGGTVSGTTVTKTGTYGTLSLDTSSGAYTFTPVDSAIEALTSNATDSFTFTVSDSNGGTDSKTLALNLTGANDAPTLQNAIADQIAKQDTAFSFTFDANTFIDVDAGDSLTYSATLQDGSKLPNWLKFDAATLTFSGTPTNADFGNLAIVLQAKDQSGVSSTDTFALAVEQNNGTPDNGTPDNGTPNNGTPTFKLSKIADDIFNISNSSGKSKLQVTLTGRSSNLVNELGVFTVDDAQGNIQGIAPGAAGYAQAALDRAKVIFSAIAKLPNGFNTSNLTHLLEFNSSDNLRFYLVKNSTTDAVRAGATPLTDMLFSDPLTQKITDLGNDDFSLAWKDGSGKNAADFNNLVVKVQSTNDSLPLGTNLQGNSQGEVIDLRGVTSQVKADFVVNREAAFKNFIGFYQVADENGGIDTNGDGKADILTGQAGYTEAAVRGRVAGIDLTVNNQGTASYTGTFQPGSIFAPFIIANGTPDALLDKNPNNNPAVYFPFLGANADKVDHIRLLGNNIFGFEDLPSGGDKDFNDMIVRVNMSIA
ncbi:MAG: DUF4347 domain-containing protein [Nostoc sp. NOS(2021)]|uniref:DUF4347 domain-containing protein n=1 Tax=Nostoc sp. NOS(2021) TaxID=2815407 RepID=UPI0025EBB604|nr:DUF4347 domain-containing protein [Nostoc sp. NOS(2021)]MBN3894640.1 DUF4347 domain-containing protein [Nostoc sp. NOS(2021)]